VRPSSSRPSSSRCSKRLTLNQGANVIRAAIVNAGGATDFCARFLDRDDAPVKGIAVDLLER
jgi:hypothetical protein